MPCMVPDTVLSKFPHDGGTHLAPAPCPTSPDHLLSLYESIFLSAFLEASLNFTCACMPLELKPCVLLTLTGPCWVAM